MRDGKRDFALDRDVNSPYYKVRNKRIGKELIMPVSTVTSKGQTTIPKEIREHLKLHPGDRIDFIIESEGRVVIEPATAELGDLEGILYKPGRKAVSVEEMKQTVKKRFRKKK